MNIVFAGTPEFAAQHLSGLLENGIPISAVVSQPDKPGKRGKKLIPSPVKVTAEAKGIPVLQPEKFSAEDLEALQPDLLIVVAYGQILRQKLLDTPKFGCINVHGSLLPRWRGAAPIQRAIEAGDAETGICIMQMDAGLDTGPVHFEAKTPIDPSDTSAELSHRLVGLGVKGLIEVIQKFEQGTAQATPQPEEGANYAKKILKIEALLDWSQTAEELRRKIHAFNPDPICFTSLEYQDQTLRVKLHSVKGVHNDQVGSAPGEVVEVTGDGVLIGTGAGCILVDKLQLPLGKGSILSGRDILNSRSDVVFPGARFGSG